LKILKYFSKYFQLKIIKLLYIITCLSIFELQVYIVSFMFVKSYFRDSDVFLKPSFNWLYQILLYYILQHWCPVLSLYLIFICFSSFFFSIFHISIFKLIHKHFISNSHNLKLLFKFIYSLYSLTILFTLLILWILSRGLQE